MSKLTIEPFVEEHLHGFEFHPHELSVGINRNAVMDLNQTTVLATLLHQGTRAVAFIGFVELWRGVFEVFLIPSTVILQSGFSVARLVKRYIGGIFNDLNAHRLQTACFPLVERVRFLEFLGFHQEGQLEKYSVNKDTYTQWGYTG